jgi:hypothetical protein
MRNTTTTAISTETKRLLPLNFHLAEKKRDFILDEINTGSANHRLGVTNDHCVICAPAAATSLVLAANNRRISALTSSTGQRYPFFSQTKTALVVALKARIVALRY